LTIKNFYKMYIVCCVESPFLDFLDNKKIIKDKDGSLDRYNRQKENHQNYPKSWNETRVRIFHNKTFYIVE